MFLIRFVLTAFLLAALFQPPPIQFEVTPESLAAVAGIALSLLFSYAPGLADWYNALGTNPDGTTDGGTMKRLVMLGLLLLTTLAVFGLACGGVIAGVACTQAGFTTVFWMFVQAAIANQMTHMASPRIGKKRVLKKPIEPALYTPVAIDETGQKN